VNFFLEKGLQKLGRWLRFLGYKVYFVDRADNFKKFIRSADVDKTIIVTTSRKISDYLKSRKIEHILVPRDSWEFQLFLVIKRLNIKPELKLNICVYCNNNLKEIDKEIVKDKLPRGVLLTGKDFTKCDHCGAIFWKGSHYRRMVEKLERILRKYNSLLD